MFFSVLDLASPHTAKNGPCLPSPITIGEGKIERSEIRGEAGHAIS